MGKIPQNILQTNFLVQGKQSTDELQEAVLDSTDIDLESEERLNEQHSDEV